MSHVACHLSLTPTATSTATHPPPANSPIKHSKLDHKDQKKNENKSKCKKSSKQQKTEISRGMPILQGVSSNQFIFEAGARA